MARPPGPERSVVVWGTELRCASRQICDCGKDTNFDTRRVRTARPALALRSCDLPHLERQRRAQPERQSHERRRSPGEGKRGRRKIGLQLVRVEQVVTTTLWRSRNSPSPRQVLSRPHWTNPGSLAQRLLLRSGRSSPCSRTAPPLPGKIVKDRLLRPPPASVKGAIETRREGRYKFHYLNTEPLEHIADRWLRGAKEGST
jgi:hypothetical protein